jgi:hypothetical protein
MARRVISDDMTETATQTPAPEPVTPATFGDVLRNPKLLATRRAELVQLATDRASELAADARAKLETAQKNVFERAQSFRRNADATLRHTAGAQLERAASALQALAKRVQPGCGCGGHGEEKKAE